MYDMHFRTAADVAGTDWTGFNVATWDIGRHSIDGTDIRVRTSRFPTYGCWMAIVDGPDGLIRALGSDEFRYATREAAQDGHALLVKRVNAWHDALVAA